jgi:hypothetical protein
MAYMLARSAARPMAVLPVLVIFSLLAGCSGEERPGQAATSASSSPDPVESPSPARSTPPPKPTSADSATPASEAYGLDLPRGIKLTELGTDLKLGQTARVAWELKEGTAGLAAISVTRLRKGALKDLAGFTLDDRTRKSTPYYVDARVKNIGTVGLGGVATPLYLVDGNDVLVEASSFQSTFAPCAAKPLPEKFPPGAAAKVCLVYIAAERGTLRAVSFRPEQAYAPIEWTGELTQAAAGAAPEDN